MNNEEFFELDPQEFRKAIEFYADSTNVYSKQELYNAFVVVTKLYLDELISARQMESLLVREYGEEATNDFFKTIAESNDETMIEETITAFEEDPEAVIKAKFDTVERLSGEI